MAEQSPVVGLANGRLEIERVNNDVRVLGVTTDKAVGGSLFNLFDVSSATDVLQALSEVTRTSRGLGLIVKVRLDGIPAMVQLTIWPLEPGPSFSFSFACPGADPRQESNADERTLQQFGRGLHAHAPALTGTLLDESDVTGVAKLSTRERDITGRLLSGDRVPAIAQTVYLSQSTVRNHLSSVFRKLGVASQQQLIELFRESADRIDDRADIATPED